LSNYSTPKETVSFTCNISSIKTLRETFTRRHTQVLVHARSRTHTHKPNGNHKHTYKYATLTQAKANQSSWIE